LDAFARELVGAEAPAADEGFYGLVVDGRECRELVRELLE
jgi:hypothetical protein